MTTERPGTLLLTSWLAAAVLVAGCTESEPQQTTEAVNIGVIAPLSGNMALIGNAFKSGLELAREELKAVAEVEGGAATWMVLEDSEGSAEGAVTAYRRLVDVYQSPVIIGAMSSEATRAVAALAERDRVVLVSPAASDHGIAELGDHVFSLNPSDRNDERFLSELIASRPGIGSVALLSQTSGYTSVLADVFAERLVAAGGEVALGARFDSGSLDFAETLGTAAEGGVDGVVVFGDLEHLALIFGQSRHLGLNLDIVAITTLEDPFLFDPAAVAAMGFGASSGSRLEDFATRFQQTAGAAPSLWAAHGYDALNLVARVLDESDGTPRGIRRALHRIPSFAGVTGSRSFDSEGRVRSSFYLTWPAPTGGVERPIPVWVLGARALEATGWTGRAKAYLTRLRNPPAVSERVLSYIPLPSSEKDEDPAPAGDAGGGDSGPLADSLLTRAVVAIRDFRTQDGGARAEGLRAALAPHVGEVRILSGTAGSELPRLDSAHTYRRATSPGAREAATRLGEIAGVTMRQHLSTATGQPDILRVIAANPTVDFLIVLN